MSNQRGFTLIEMLLSVGIISILAGVSIPLYASFNARTELDTTTESVAGMLRRAQTYARGMNADSEWSVRLQNGSAVLFRGTSYAARDTAYDEATAIPGTYTLAGPTDITFSKLSAEPSTTGAITLTAPNNESRTVTLNAKGMVNY